MRDVLAKRREEAARQTRATAALLGDQQRRAHEIFHKDTGTLSEDELGDLSESRKAIG
jgi:hypothetical protein